MPITRNSIGKFTFKQNSIQNSAKPADRNLNEIPTSDLFTALSHHSTHQEQWRAQKFLLEVFRELHC